MPGGDSLIPWSRERNEFSKGVVSMLFKASRTSGLTGGVGGTGGNGVKGESGAMMFGSLILARALC